MRLTSPRSIIVAFALLGAGALYACSSDGATFVPADHPAALLTAGDFDTASTGSESSNLMFALQEAGFPLDTASGMDSTTIAGLIAGKDVLFLPEISPDFDAGTEAILKHFVDNGGTIVLVGGYDHIDWVNATFGWSLSNPDEWGDGSPMPRLAGASLTPFAGGPATIASNNGGGSLDIASLPTGARAIYGSPDTTTTTLASVVILRSGSGHLVYFGWDWFNGAPHGEQDGGWRKLLGASSGF
jgi:hypothetical protein